MSHLYSLGLNMVRDEERRKNGGAGEGRPEDEKGAFSYSSDSNLDVNCRLMSRRSGTMLGNHTGIQENEARTFTFLLDRCTAERRFICAGSADSGAHTCCHTAADSSLSHSTLTLILLFH